MSDQSRDLYADLDLARDATAEQIKRAHQKAKLKYHPDRIKDKSEAGIAEAKEKLAAADEAFKILGEGGLKKIYDASGYDAVVSVLRDAGANVSAPSAAPSHHYDIKLPEEDLFVRFGVPDLMQPSPQVQIRNQEEVDAETRARAEARRLSREARRRGEPAPAPVVQPPPVQRPAPPAQSSTSPAPRSSSPMPSYQADAFRAAAQKLADIANKTADMDVGGNVPVHALDRLKRALDDFSREVDRAMARARNNPPRPR